MCDMLEFHGEHSIEPCQTNTLCTNIGGWLYYYFFLFIYLSRAFGIRHSELPKCCEMEWNFNAKISSDSVQLFIRMDWKLNSPCINFHTYEFNWYPVMKMESIFILMYWHGWQLSCIHTSSSEYYVLHQMMWPLSCF